MIDEFYTPLEVAKMLRVTRSTIYEHIKSGQLKAIRVGNRYRITKTHLEEYIRQNVVNAKKSVVDPKREKKPII
jgi:excisionase family DNA binding protein